MISYAPLWKTMREKGISQYRLLRAGIDNKTLDALKKGRNITLLTLEKLCLILDCSPNEVVEFIEDSPKGQ
ncbi:MAG: helix-turn-helix domain-containing protein [Clostridia bacterium]|nr:helix-turn-helix domain-containing protein [Clostridia bacterium]